MILWMMKMKNDALHGQAQNLLERIIQRMKKGVISYSLFVPFRVGKHGSEERIVGIFPTLMKSVYASLGILSESATSQLFKKYEFRSQ